MEVKATPQSTLHLMATGYTGS